MPEIAGWGWDGRDHEASILIVVVGELGWVAQGCAAFEPLDDDHVGRGSRGTDALVFAADRRWCWPL